MLPRIARLKPGLSSRSRWSLLVGSLVLFALPTWFVAAQSDTKEETKTTSPNQAVAAQFASPTIEFFPEESKKEKTIVQQLDMPTSFDFTDESLDGVRETIMERHGFDIILDKINLEEESIASDATDITLKVNEIPLRSALRLLLRTKKLAFVIEDDVMKITTETACQDDRLTRTYPVRDLTEKDGADYPSLIEAVTQGVMPGSWQDFSHAARTSFKPATTDAGKPPASGVVAKRDDTACTISVVPASGSLVIRQSWQGHDEVLKLLRALRKAKGESAKK